MTCGPVRTTPGKAVSIYVAPDRSTVTGQWELHFGDRYKGHYYWYCYY